MTIARRLGVLLFILGASPPLLAADRISAVDQKLSGFDTYIGKILRDWNGVGIGVGIVADDRLVFARGYGYRDFDKKLPITPQTLFPIASNTKLFTAVAAGLLVEEGKLTWDRPIRESVPTIRFYNDSLNNSVTLRDMLSHRTGVTRHDWIWFHSEFTPQELFDRLEYLEPSAPLRQSHLYNNLMYSGVGQAITLRSGRPWSEFVRERILMPLRMDSTIFSARDAQSKPDHAVPYAEHRDSNQLYAIPYYEQTYGIEAAGGIISNMEDLSHWLAALMNDGRYQEKQVLPANVLKATLEPGIALPDTLGAHGWHELLNPSQTMGRRTASYRGHFIAYHGGALGGFYSQISYLPFERVGVIVFTIGEHTRNLIDPISYNIYERLLGMSQTPWSQRWLEVRQKDKQAKSDARKRSGVARVAGTRPSHAVQEYAGDYENPAYGTLQIGLKNNELQFTFHGVELPLAHFHYDRFDTADDEQDGKWSVNFATNPAGDIDRLTVSLDEAEAIFTRRAPRLEHDQLLQLAGPYESPNRTRFEIVLNSEDVLVLQYPGRTDQRLIPYKGLKFRVADFSDVLYEFVQSEGRITAIRQTDPTGEFLSPRRPR